ncbi:MAG: glycosyltransferase family 9 protein [Candidatus Firestonebacteria bacterium]|nr:glycosyltransferase family 9 protein [Candidatus Firestonebacteria bacterium]
MQALNPKRILVIQIRRIGDVLVTTPVVRALRLAFPEAKLDFLSNDISADVLYGNSNIDEIVIMSEEKTSSYKGQLKFIKYIRNRNYDLVLDFLGTPRSAYITAFSGALYKVGFNFRGRAWAYNIKVEPDESPKYVVDYKFDLLKKINVMSDDTSLDKIIIPEINKNRVEKYLSDIKITSDNIIITISPTSRRKTRMWTKKGFAELSDILINKYRAKIFFVWGPGEKAEIDEICSLMKNKAEIIPPFDLKDLAYLISRANLFISNDNGPMHIAVAMGTPTLTIYGPSEEWRWTPPNDPKHRVVRKDVSCIRCGKHECDNHICMNTLTAEEIEIKVRDML